MKKFLALAAVVAFATTVSAQCPGSCGQEKAGEKGQVVKKQEEKKQEEKKSCCQDEKAGYTAKLATLAKNAENGCESSKAKLAAMKKELGVECCSEFSAKVAELEKNAGNGCESSKAKLVKLFADQDKKEAKKDEKKPVEAKKEECSGKECEPSACCEGETASAKLAALVKASANCKESAAKLAAMKKEMGTEKDADLVAKVAELEKNAGKGCDTSKAKLAKMFPAAPKTEKAKEVKKDGEAKKDECSGKECDSSECCMTETVSGMLTSLAKNAEGGCEASKAKIVAMKKELGIESCEEFKAKIAELEKNAGKGCDTSKAKLATLKKLGAGEAKKDCGEKKECEGEKKECPVQKVNG